MNEQKQRREQQRRLDRFQIEMAVAILSLRNARDAVDRLRCPSRDAVLEILETLIGQVMGTKDMVVKHIAEELRLNPGKEIE